MGGGAQTRTHSTCGVNRQHEAPKFVRVTTWACRPQGSLDGALPGRCPRVATMSVRHPPPKWVAAVDFPQAGDFGTAKSRGDTEGGFPASFPADGAATTTIRAGQPPTCVSCIQAGTFAAPQMKSQPTIALGRITGPLSRGRRARPAQSHTTGPGVSARRAPVTHRPEPPLLARSVHDRVRHQAQWRREACSGTRKRTSRPRGR